MKILVIRFSSIGDIILSTSPLTSLRKRFPDARIDFITLVEFAPLLESHPYIDNLLTLEKSAGYGEIKATGKFLDSLKYDLVVDFHNTLRSKILCSGLQSGEKRILKKPRWKRFKLFQFHWNNFSEDFSQLYLLHQPIFDLLDQINSLPATFLYISPIEKEKVLYEMKANGVTGDYVVLIPGAAWHQKMWSVDKYCEVIQSIQGSNLNIVILGARSDSICEELHRLNPAIIDLHGRTSLRESLAIISQAKLVLGSDTGFVHGAEALNVPALMILGPTSRETGGGTYLRESVMIENSNLWCRPCSQNGSRPCYREEQYCMTSISSGRVWSAAKRILATC